MMWTRIFQDLAANFIAAKEKLHAISHGMTVR